MACFCHAGAGPIQGKGEAGEERAMVWGASFWQRVRQSSVLGALVAIVFVVAVCVLGVVGILQVDGFHLAGG